MDTDVIIMGAGYAGLAAADGLASAGKQVTVVEARERVGGRTRTDHYEDGLWLDLGGQWLGPGHDHLYALAKRFDKKVWAMHVDGRHTLHVRGRNRYFRGDTPPLGVTGLANLAWAFARLSMLARRVSLYYPWQTPAAHKLDQQTLGDWMRRHVYQRDARALLQSTFEAIFAAHPDDISLLHALFYIHSGKGLRSLTSATGGAQQDRIEGGLQGLAESWLADLRRRDVNFVFDSPVRAVEQDAHGVRVHADAGSWTAGHVICTLPPALTLDVDFRPALPEARRAWCEGMPPGDVIKCFAVYDTPFWREQGLSGLAAGDHGPVHVAFDITPPDSDQGILLGFIEGREARRWSEADADERREAALQSLARFFGEQARSPVRYIDHCWGHETWSGGCYAGVARPGILTATGDSARTPHGRIHWAGTETAIHWNGYIEGAIYSGIRAASEVAPEE